MPRRPRSKALTHGIEYVGDWRSAIDRARWQSRGDWERIANSNHNAISRVWLTSQLSEDKQGSIVVEPSDSARCYARLRDNTLIRG